MDIVERMHYGGRIDLADHNDPRSRIVRMVAPGSRVLEIGCGSGTIIAHLIRERNCTGIGVELDATMVAEADAKGITVFWGDIESADTQCRVAAEAAFDYVIMADVVEHLRHPARVLAAARPWLKPDGEVLASVPNVAYWSVRLMLLAGRWQYTDGYIMDRGHMTWFTRASIVRLFQDAGYVVAEIQDRWAPLPGERIWRRLFPHRYRLYAWLVSRWPGFFAYQFVIRAHPMTVQDS